MILKRPVTIARRGTILGEFSSSDLPVMLERGEIRADDYCFIDETNTWQTVDDHIHATSTPKAKAALEENVDVTQKFQGPSLLLGTAGLVVLGVVMLFALGLLGGAGAWIYSLQKQLQTSSARVLELQTQLLDRPDGSVDWDPKHRIPADRKKVVGQAYLLDSNGAKQLLSGFFVDLYREKEIRDYLLSRSLNLAAHKQTKNPEIITKLLKNMPVPILKTVTDASGFYEFEVPEAGRYVVYSSITLDRATGPEMPMWFLSFGTDDALNLPVDIKEDNQVDRMEPEYMIKLGRPVKVTKQ